MILNIFMLLLGYFLIFSFGYKLTGIFLPKADKFEKISLGYLLGIGIFTLMWFLINWTGIPYNLLSGFILIAVLNLIVMVIYRVKYGTWFEKIKYDFGYFHELILPEKIELWVLIFICLSAVIQSLYWPVHSWDSLVLYDFRAKVFVQTGFMQAAIDKGYFFSYPLLTSIAHTWVYLLNWISPNFLYALWYLALLMNFAVNLRKLKIRRVAVLFLTLAIAISPRLFDHTQWAYTNLPYSIYLTLGYIYLYFGVKEKNFGLYIISAILIGLSNWTRALDPFWLTAVLAAVIFPFSIRKKYWLFIYLGIVGFFVLPWRVFQSIYNLGATGLNPAPLALHNLIENLNTPFLRQVSDFIIANVIQIYLIYFVLLALLIIVKLYTKSKEWLFTSFIIFDLLLVFAGTIILASNTDYWKDIPDSLARMAMFVPILIIFLTGELLAELKHKSLP